MRSRSIATAIMLAAGLAGGVGHVGARSTIDNPGPVVRHEESRRERQRRREAIKRGSFLASGRATGWTVAADKRRAQKARNVKREKARS